MQNQTVEYQADGLQMIGQVFQNDSAGKRPGVLVFPEAFGVSPHSKAVAERLAGLGFVAMAADLHGGAKLVSDLNEALGLLAPIRETPPKIRARSEGALAALLAQPGVDAGRIGAIGFCFGGTMALELGRGGADVAAIVGFHSGLSTKQPAQAGHIKGRVLVCIGADDPAIDAEQRAAFEREMKDAGANWQISVYGGVVHSFTNKDADKLGRPEFAKYSEQADRRSWGEMMAVFGEAFQ
jgi:dienelactone hydrolase